MRKNAFTLMEILVVMIILAILATLAISSYGRFLEKSRAAEARLILGTISEAEMVQYDRHNTYAALTDLPVDLKDGNTCEARYYFKYQVTGVSANTFTATATRCVVDEGGKQPPGPSAYTITLNQDGTWTSGAGF